MASVVLYGLAHFANVVLNLATLILIITSALSWFNVDRQNRYVRIIEKLGYGICKPFYTLSRNIPGPFDFAPMLALLVIIILQKTIPVLLMSLSLQMK